MSSILLFEGKERLRRVKEVTKIPPSLRVVINSKKESPVDVAKYQLGISTISNVQIADEKGKSILNAYKLYPKLDHPLNITFANP